MRRASRGLLRGMGAPLVGLLLLAACGEDRAAPERLLPAVSPSGIPAGGIAGPTESGAGTLASPYAGDRRAIAEGRRLYQQMNCSECHGYDARGGMCPNLVDGEWLFGDTPASRFSSVHGGRASGMPAYGSLLPDESIWKIVAYVESLGDHGSGGGRRAGGGGPTHDYTPRARH